MITRKQKTETPSDSFIDNKKTPIKVITLPSEYFVKPKHNVKVGIRLPSYRDIQGCLDSANHDTEALNISDESKKTEFFNLSLATHLVGVCLTNYDDYSVSYFQAGGDAARDTLHPSSIIKIYNEITAMYEVISEIREPLNDVGVDRFIFLFKSLPEDSPIKNRLRVGFAFLLDMLQ